MKDAAKGSNSIFDYGLTLRFFKPDFVCREARPSPCPPAAIDSERHLGRSAARTSKTAADIGHSPLPSARDIMGSADKQPARAAALARDTNETKIQLALNIDGGELPPDTHPRLLEATTAHASQSTGSQMIAVNTGIGFLDHMLHALAKHAGWSLALNCQGDLHSRLPPRRVSVGLPSLMFGPRRSRRPPHGRGLLHRSRQRLWQGPRHPRGPGPLRLRLRPPGRGPLARRRRSVQSPL